MMKPYIYRDGRIIVNPRWSIWENGRILSGYISFNPPIHVFEKSNPHLAIDAKWRV